MNNLIITDNINNINLEDLNIGQSIIVHNETKTDFNKILNTKQIFNIYMLTNKIDIAYGFSIIKNSINIGYINEDQITIVPSSADSYKSFLTLNNNKISISLNDTEYIETQDLSYQNKQYYSIFKEMYTEISNSNNNTSLKIIYTNKNNSHITYLHALLKYKNNYIGFTLIDNINNERKHWVRRDSGFLFNKDFSGYVSFIFVNKKRTDIINALNSIKKNLNKNDKEVINRLIKKFSCVNLDIKDVLGKPNRINNLTNSLVNDFYDCKKVINNLLEPILIDEQEHYKAYSDSFENYNGDIFSVHDKIGFKRLCDLDRKAEAILQYRYFEDKRIIDIYTGDIIDKDYVFLYRDSETLYLNNHSYYYGQNLFFEKIDEVFVSVEKKEKKEEIIKRKDLLDKLTE